MLNDESQDHERTVTTDSCIRYYDTGAGYLVFKVRFEYHPNHDYWFPIEHSFRGAYDVEDWGVIEEKLRDLGLNRRAVRHVPEYTLTDRNTDL